MKTYTEKEVEKLLNSQKTNCWVALNSLTKDENLLNAVSFSPEPGNWRDKKKYVVVFENTFIIDIDAIPVNYTDLDWEEAFKKLATTPLVFCGEKEIKPVENVKVEISKETTDFLKVNCNIERNKYGEDTYILNNLRFKIIEE